MTNDHNTPLARTLPMLATALLFAFGCTASTRASSNAPQPEQDVRAPPSTTGAAEQQWPEECERWVRCCLDIRAAMRTLLESTTPPHPKKWLDSNISFYCPFDTERMLQAQKEDRLTVEQLKQQCIAFHKTLPQNIISTPMQFPSSCDPESSRPTKAPDRKA